MEDVTDTKPEEAMIPISPKDLADIIGSCSEDGFNHGFEATFEVLRVAERMGLVTITSPDQSALTGLVDIGKAGTLKEYKIKMAADLAAEITKARQAKEE